MIKFLFIVYEIMIKFVNLNKKLVIFLLLSLLTISGCSLNRAIKTEKITPECVGNGDCASVESTVIKKNVATTTNDGVKNKNATSSIVDASNWPIYENTEFGYRIKYPPDYKAIGDGGESARSGVTFFNTKIEKTPFKTGIHIYDQNYITGYGSDYAIFDFTKEKIKDVYDLEAKNIFPGTIEKINNLNFLKLSGTDRIIYVVQNPNNLKFLAFEAYVPVQYEKVYNDEKIKNLDAMIKTLFFIEPTDSWQSFEDKSGGFIVNYPGPLQLSKDLFSSQTIFAAQFFYNEDAMLPMNHVKVLLSKVIVDKNKSFDSVVADAAKVRNANNIFLCSIGGKSAKCFNGKEYNEYGEIDTVYSENIFFENNSDVYNMYFYSPGSIKNKFGNIFKEIQNKFKFIK